MGAIPYRAPEVAAGKHYGKPADIWSLGIILFAVLTGAHPFKLYENYMLVDYDRARKVLFHTRPDLSPDCIDLISKLLQRDPSMRPAYEQIVAHPFLQNTQSVRVEDKSSNLEGVP